MTAAPPGFDVSFLSDEEARKILQVLERNEELRRAEKERISKLQKTKRNIRWLQGVTGEWFEEIQRKKFCNETDVGRMLKQPLTCRLRRGMAKPDPVELHTSISKNVSTPKTPTSFPSPLSFRSSFASLFSFRKSTKESLKLPTALGQKGCDGLAGPPVSVRETAGAKIYSIPLESQLVHSAFAPKPADMREGRGMPSLDASMLENEFFRVLDDLDSKLAQEQSSSSVNTRTPFDYESRAQFSRFPPWGSRPGNVTGRHNRYNETPSMSIYDILRPGAPREGFKTFSPRTKTIYDMYRTKELRVLEEDHVQKNAFGSSSLCFDSRQQRSASPAARHFTARSSHFPAPTQNRNAFIPWSHQQSPKRTPLSSIIWNRSDSFRDGQNQDGFLKAPLPMEVDPPDQDTYPRGFQETRRYEFYQAQGAFQNVSAHAATDSAMDPDPFENSENMPFYPQDNPFARSFFSNTFGRNRGQRVGQSPFWGQQEDHSSWSDFYRNRKHFSSSPRDFEMISTETAHIAPAYGHGAPSQHWGSFSPGYGPNNCRAREPCPWQWDLQTCTLESMEVSRGSGNQLAPPFSTPNVYPVTAPSCPPKTDRLECHQGRSPREGQLNKGAYVYEIDQPRPLSFTPSFPQMSDDRLTSHTSSFQNLTATLQKIPSESVLLPGRSPGGVSVSSSDSIDPPPLADSQPNILVMEKNTEKALHDSISEKYQQRNKMDQTNIARDTPSPVSQTVTPDSFLDVHRPLSQPSAENDGLVFNASTSVSSERSLRVLPWKDVSKIYVPQGEKASELNQEKGFSGTHRLDSATSPPFLQRCRISPLSHSPDQGGPQELTLHDEATPSLVQNNLWSTDSPDNPNPQSLAKSVTLDTEGEPRTDAASPSVSGSQEASPPNSSSLGALGMHATPGFSRRSPPGNDPSLEDGAGENRQRWFALSPSESPKDDDDRAPIRNDVLGAATAHSHQPLNDGKERGKRRRRIENFSNPESRSTPTNDSGDVREVDQGDYKSPGACMIYCTLPRTPPSFPTTRRKSESKAMAVSFRNGLPPFQVKNRVEEPVGKQAPDQVIPSPPESESKCPKVASDLASAAPAAPRETSTRESTGGTASQRKGSLPFRIPRTMSDPSGETLASVGEDGRDACSGSGTYAAAVSPRPWEGSTCALASDPSVESQSHPAKASAPARAAHVAPTQAAALPLSAGEPVPPSSGPSGQEARGPTLHRYKTTSMFSVSGDEENVRCLEVVSIYYMLPRKPSKALCDLLQMYTQNANSSPESPRGETAPGLDASRNDKLDGSTAGPSGAPPREDGEMPLCAAPGNLPGPPHLGAKQAASQGANRAASERPLQDVPNEASNLSPDNWAKTPGRDSRSRKKKGKKLQREPLPTPSRLQGGNVTEGKSGNCQRAIKSGNGAPSAPPAPSGDSVEDSHTVSSGAGTAVTATRRGQRLQEDVTARAVHDSSNGLQARGGSGTKFTDCHQMPDRALSDTENQVSAVTLALHNLQFDEETCAGAPEVAGLHTDPKETPQSSLEVDMTEVSKAKDEMPSVAWDPPSQPGKSDGKETRWHDLGKGKNRPSGTRTMAAMSKASSAFSAKDCSSRRHVATIFNKSGGSPSVGGLAAHAPENDPLSPEPVLRAESADEGGRSRNGGGDEEEFESPLQLTVTSDQTPATPFRDQKPAGNIAHWNVFKGSSEAPPLNENSSDRTVAQPSERGSETQVQPPVTGFREAGSAGHQRRPSSSCPLELAHDSPGSTPRNCQQQQGSSSPPEWGSEPHLYRSKSLKNISVHGDKLRKSRSPKVRERHFSESTSVEDALSRLTQGNEFSFNDRYNRRFKSFSELPSCEENESWTLYSDRTKAGPRPATSISRPIDYGIFGKEQQLAFLENVKRSLTQGRLWKPSFLKNPGFLKNDLINSPNPSESLSSNSPSGQRSKDGLSPMEPLNIYEEDPVDSDQDSDTTTDDEYYLDENDKESEL
ncbi:exophilin-5 [Tenrec ecaudatus]|uniref:exophilin-5 n=1 Tax=Tenrec ecaudatus TaxID=94439 RepID=UPI003F59D211